MIFPETMGGLFVFQKFIIIPNYSQNGSIGKIFVVFRLIPIFLVLAMSFYDIILVLFRPRLNFFRGIGPLENLVLLLDIISNRISIISIFVVGVVLNRDHMKFIFKMRKFQECLVNNHEYKGGYRLLIRSRLSTIVNLLVTLVLNICFYCVNAEEYHIRSVHGYVMYFAVMFINDMEILYFIYLIREICVLSDFLCGIKKKNDFLYLKTFCDFMCLIPELNRGLGLLLLITSIQHTISTSMSSYYVIWLIVDQRPINRKSLIVIGCIIWAGRSIIVITLLTVAGNKLNKKLEKLFRLQVSISCHIEDKKLNPYIKFNKEQFQIWRFQTEVKILAAHTYPINNHGIFLMFSSVVTYIIILFQFKQMEYSEEIMTS
uniref:Uncharacterized protein n=1 Tax=Lutzomyia longipalpis TaxID=7200 RepID=A0A3F2ZD90_LUTLO